MTSDGSDDPNRASAEAEGALLTPEEVEKVKEWPDDAVERVAIYLSGGDLASWKERADHSQHPGDTDGKDQFRRDARKLLAVLAAREDTERCGSACTCLIKAPPGSFEHAPDCPAAEREHSELEEKTKAFEALAEQERLARLRCRCGTAIAVDYPEHGGGI